MLEFGQELLAHPRRPPGIFARLPAHWDGPLPIYKLTRYSLYPILTLSVVNSRVLAANPSVLIKYFTYLNLPIRTQ